MFDVDEYQRLDDAVHGAREATQAHVRKVMSIGRGDEPLESPPEVADAAWFEEYRRLRDAEDKARRDLDDYVQRTYWRRG